MDPVICDIAYIVLYILYIGYTGEVKIANKTFIS